MVLHVVLFFGIWLESLRAEITEGMILVTYMFSPLLFDICAAICKKIFLELWVYWLIGFLHTLKHPMEPHPLQVAL